jgi:hypothetical protein
MFLNIFLGQLTLEDQWRRAPVPLRGRRIPMELRNHPTVKRLLNSGARSVGGHGDAGSPASIPDPQRRLEAGWLRQLALDCGADDAGIVEIGRPELDTQRAEVLANYPWTKAILGFVVRMTREPVRSPARSVANLEFTTPAIRSMKWAIGWLQSWRRWAFEL